jgi:hypothetical protein
MESVAELYSRLRSDKWRTNAGFSPDIAAAHKEIFQSGTSPVAVVGAWLQKYQPCLFGRLAARSGLLGFSILLDSDLQRPDDWIRDKIQLDRAAWTRAGFEGRRSGFVLLCISERIANATPDTAMEQFALRIGSLYLLDDLSPDTVYYDEVFLEKPGPERTTWKWLAGVNVFASAGDRRWWHDHRIPAGLGFSTNSVGHMVKSGRLSQAMNALDQALDDSSEPAVMRVVDSLEKALEFAMRTIYLASDTVSGKATELLPMPDPSLLPVQECPVALPQFLKGFNYYEYSGWYHTDVTVPSDYFSPDIERPIEVERSSLDFSYLFRSPGR